MGAIVLLIGIVVALWLNWFIAKQFYEVAQEKGFYDSKYQWICFLFGAAGWIMVCALPDRGNTTVPVTSDELPDL
jgi:ABC-type Fe3+ transport system permease subunit